jgi:hypothetical protein
MPIQGKGATRSAVRYVDIVARFKLAARAGQTETPEINERQKLIDDYYAEARGRRRGRRASEIDYVSRHGDVVDALREWREASKLNNDKRFVKNVFLDLGVASGEEVVEAYEVKTSTKRSNVYSAIGQLLVHGDGPDCERTIVLPEREQIAGDLDAAFVRLKIRLLKFRLDDKKATIVLGDL